MIEKKIDDVCEVGHSKSLIYKPRPGGGMNSQMHNYTDDMKDYLKDQLSEIVHFFGYAK